MTGSGRSPTVSEVPNAVGHNFFATDRFGEVRVNSLLVNCLPQ